MWHVKGKKNKIKKYQKQWCIAGEGDIEVMCLSIYTELSNEF